MGRSTITTQAECGCHCTGRALHTSAVKDLNNLSSEARQVFSIKEEIACSWRKRLSKKKTVFSFKGTSKDRSQRAKEKYWTWSRSLRVLDFRRAMSVQVKWSYSKKKEEGEMRAGDRTITISTPHFTLYNFLLESSMAWFIRNVHESVKNAYLTGKGDTFENCK